MSSHSYSDIDILRRLLRQWKAFWPHLLGVWVLSVLSVPFALLTPLPMKIAVDSYIGSDPLPGLLAPLSPGPEAATRSEVLLLAVGLAVVLALISQLVMLGTALLGTYTQEKMVLQLRTRLFPHVQHLSLSYHVTKGTSDSVYRVLFDTSAIPAIFLTGIIPFVTAILTLASMLYITFRLSGQLALVALAIAPFLLLITLVFKGRLRRVSSEVSRAGGSGQRPDRQSLRQGGE
jgi:ATP-binding cassette subfamily B protein